MRIIDAFLAEMDMEAKTTRKFLEAMPADKMGWQPHPKSMTTSQLSMHVAGLPGMMSEWGSGDEYDMKSTEHVKEQHTKEEVLKAFDESLAKAKQILGSFDDQKMMAMWTFKVNGKQAMQMPRVAFVRSFMFNHVYHHRGQFGVYLRLMGAHVPSSYGPSGDENPMAALMETASAKN